MTATTIELQAIADGGNASLRPKLVVEYDPNASPTLTLASPSDNQVLSEGSK